MDGPLIKYPLFLDVLHALNVQPHNILLLMVDTVDYVLESETAETAYRQPSSSSMNGISQNKSICEEERCRIYKCI